MTDQPWRERLYTFSDNNGIVYTVTNVPDVIKIPAEIDINPIENKTFHELLTPRFAIEQAPELAYLFRCPPIQDPLLSRLCLDSATLRPIRYDDNRTWGLALELRKSWSRLEKALGFAIDRLLLLRNSPAASSANKAEGWPDPSRCGYLRLYPTEYGARVAIRKSRDAMIILAARCSMALAVWDTATDPNVVPSWLAFLQKEGLPSFWIDALNASVISSFSHGQRVGAIIDPLLCKWLPHIPVMREAKLPLILRWRNRDDVENLCSKYPFLRPFAPPSPQECVLALAAPPRPQAPSVYMLYLNGQGRPHPFNKHLEERLSPKPHGPFQLPGEPRAAFLARMQQRVERMKTREGPGQEARRLDREAYAATGSLPKPYTRVYLWIEASEAYPDVPEAWRKLDYRAEVHYSCLEGLWGRHGADSRSYNSLFDEWDLWSTPETAAAEQLHAPEDLSLSSDPALREASVPRLSNDSPSDESGHFDHAGLLALLNDMLAAEKDRLYRQVNVPLYDVVDFSEWYLKNRYLSERYGLHPDHNVVSDSVDYTAFADAAMFDVFAFDKNSHPSFSTWEKKTYAGCAWALLQGKTESQVLLDCWDLNPQSPCFLFKDERVKRTLKVTKATGENGLQLYALEYAEDRNDLGWTLVVNSRVVLVLLRWLETVSNSEDAVFELSQIGTPFFTCKSAHAQAPEAQSQDTCSNRSLLPSYRLDTYTHNFLDYRQYSQQVLDFLRSGPRARAAMLQGGIIWRIVTEFSGQSDGIVELIRSHVCLGPTDDGKSHRIVGRRDSDSRAMVDDSLSEEEQAMLSGVTKVYAAQANQTEERSWWPKPSLWRTSGMYTGIWNPRNEQWFLRRMDEIRTGRATPMRIKDWKSALGLYRPCAKLAKIADALSSKVVDQYLLS